MTLNIVFAKVLLVFFNYLALQYLTLIRYYNVK